MPNRSLYNRVRKANLEGLEDNFEGHAASTSCVFVQLVLYIEETRQHDGSAPVLYSNGTSSSLQRMNGTARSIG